MSARQWARDLALGARFALTGGREGWTRALLTAVGVGLGVALLLLTAAVPDLLDARDRREDARQDHAYSQDTLRPSDDTLLIAHANSDFRDTDLRGRLVEAEGPNAPVPPGVSELPKPGDMVVSPALKKLLASDEGELLRDRLPYDVVGTIGEPGLIGSQELAFYAGTTGLAERLDSPTVMRIDAFGADRSQYTEPLDPVLVMLTLVIFVVLLVPVGVFVATAVRFGGERRDRRLAALRLVGADSRMTRRIAAGEALAGAVLGLVLGALFFLAGRAFASSVELFRVSVFPSDLNPSPLLALLVAVAVPAAAVLVTLIALRGVVIEPLGVVRTARPARRRLWWRLLLPLAGVAMLVPMTGQGSDNGDFNQVLVVGGVLCLLVGVTALLPWIVETVVARLGAGGLAWQLAVRRLQLSSGTAARMVNGIAVAVAGAIALQMLFTGIEGQYTRDTGQDVSRAQMQVDLPDGVPVAPAAAAFDKTEGVRYIQALSHGYAYEKLTDDPEEAVRGAQLTVGDCDDLRALAKLPGCRDGDVFALTDVGHDTDTPFLNKPGRSLHMQPNGDTAAPQRDVVWTVPEGVKSAAAVEDPSGMLSSGFLLTPGAVTPGVDKLMSGRLWLGIDESVADAQELVRNTAASVDPLAHASTWVATERVTRFDSIRTGLFVGATAVLFLIGTSLLVSQLEQLRERRKLLSALVAFGTRRRTLSLSVLWQTAVPIGLGLVLSSLVGTVLGAVLLRMTATPVRVDWGSVAGMAAVGAGVVALVTLLSLPPLLKMMRPDGLRTE
ncbi:ABC transporter permease [Streptomyces sp. DSM 41972]|uniref:ABC transporter permease n=1 Tax=Streptomyces althioticus subsp. attaecolombicae TaxID=3075534 RepID=A0ABU3HTI6_9ACTN|nr:ABC transporter permease [Streptomyces sp. DSM 41972]SCD58898.1 FtsX-like permease family protein [Streptomyces sp. di50b]SCD59825.1 FtsX-like permease family protein [Streptomyces sp. di188]